MSSRWLIHSRGSHKGLPLGPSHRVTAVKVRFRLAGSRNEIDADARVAWIDRRIGMGLQFTRVTPGDQILIDNYVKSHFFSNRKA